MVKKLLRKSLGFFASFIFIILVLSSLPIQTFAQNAADIACSPAVPCPTQINCSVGCLDVNLTCVNGLCRVPAYGICTATYGMSNKGCINQFRDASGVLQNIYCTRNPDVGNYTCQPAKPDGASCTDNTECQPSAFRDNGNRACAINQCNQPTGGPYAASCCSAGTFWCASNSRCTAQGDGSCPCAVTPTADPCAVATGKPNICPCSTSGTTSECASNYCNGTTSQVAGNTGIAGSLTCQTRPTVTTTIAVSPIPSLSTTCDPDKTGASLNKVDDLDFAWWQAEFFGTRITKNADCKTDQIIDIFDFNKMRDIRYFNGH